MIKNHKNLKHLNDLIVGAITHGNYNDFIYYINKYPNDELERLKASKFDYNTSFLFYALVKSQYEISKYLIQIGFDVKNMSYLLKSTRVENLESVFNNLIKVGYDLSMYDKQGLIVRILNHTKLNESKERINVFYKYVESGFFSNKDVNRAINYLIKEDKVKNSVIKSVIREYQLNKILSYNLITEGKGKDKKIEILRSYAVGFNKILKDSNIDFGVVDDMLLDFQDEVTSLIVNSNKRKYFECISSEEDDQIYLGANNSLVEEDDDSDDMSCTIESCRTFYKSLRKEKFKFNVTYDCSYQLSDNFVNLYKNGKYKKFFDQIDMRCKAEDIEFKVEFFPYSGHNTLDFLFVYTLDKSIIKDPVVDIYQGIPSQHINQLVEFTYKQKFSEKDNEKLASIIRDIIKATKGEKLNEAKKMKVNYDEFFKLNYDNFQDILVKNNIDLGELEDTTLNLRDEITTDYVNKNQCFYVTIPHGRNLSLYTDNRHFTDFEDNTEKAQVYMNVLEFFNKIKIIKSSVVFTYTIHIEAVDSSKFDHNGSDVVPFLNEIKSRCNDIGVKVNTRTSYRGVTIEFICNIDKSTVLNPNEIPLDRGKLSKDIDLKLGDLMARKRFTQKDKEDLMAIINSISSN